MRLGNGGSDAGNLQTAIGTAALMLVLRGV
jgi:hypothetical protein